MFTATKMAIWVVQSGMTLIVENFIFSALGLNAQ